MYVLPTTKWQGLLGICERHTKVVYMYKVAEPFVSHEVANYCLESLYRIITHF